MLSVHEGPVWRAATDGAAGLNKPPPEDRKKAPRLALDHLDEYGSPYAAVHAIGPMIDMHPETPRLWIMKALKQPLPQDKPAASSPTAVERAEPSRLCKENQELKQANEILELASAFFARTRPTRPLIVEFIDEYRHVFGVESTCRARSAHGIQIAPRTHRKARRRPPSDRDIAGPVVHSVYNGYWYWGCPSVEDLRRDPRDVTREIRSDWNPTTPELRAAWRRATTPGTIPTSSAASPAGTRIDRRRILAESV
jgi:transposase